MIETQKREAELQRLNDENKMKLLDSLADEESRKEAEIVKLQRLKDEERKVLNDRMFQAEQQSDYLIKELMESSQRFSDPSSVMKALEEDKKNLEKQFTIFKGDAEKLREADIRREFNFHLSACIIFCTNNFILKGSMQLMMEEEMQKKATIKIYQDRECVIQSALTRFINIIVKIYKTLPINPNISSTLESDKAVEDVLASKGREKTALITKMLDDEKYQREAFQALLLQQDHKALEISEQMSRIQNELAALTSVELKKKDLKVCLLHWVKCPDSRTTYK